MAMAWPKSNVYRDSESEADSETPDGSEGESNSEEVLPEMAYGAVDVYFTSKVQALAIANYNVHEYH